MENNKDLAYEPVKEMRVVWLIKELGRASLEQVQEVYVKRFGEEHKDLELVLQRWNDRKVIAKIGRRYKIANVPPHFMSLQMDHMINLSPDVAQKDIDEMMKVFEGNSKVGTKKGVLWGNYGGLLEMEFEAVDNILGGRPSEQDLSTVFPRDSTGKLVVPSSWLHGLLRDNQRIFNVSNLHDYVGWGNGIWAEGTELTKVDAPLIINGKGAGVGHYEAVKAGSRFKVYCNWPMKGHDLNTVEKLREFFQRVEFAPIRGMGANPRYEGGRVRLLSVKEAKPTQNN